MNEQDTQTVERVAAAMWKAETINSGTPQSVIDARTPESFASQSSDLRAKWHKLARAAISAMPDTTAQSDKIKSLIDAVEPLAAESRCRCAYKTRSLEIAYETGKCPHQKARAVIASAKETT